MGPGDLPGFDSTADALRYRKELQAQGHDGITLDYSGLGGPVQHVAFESHQAIPARGMKIVDEAGREQSAASEQARVVGEEAQGNKEADPMFKAAINCEARHQ